MCSINIGNKVCLNPILPIWTQSLRDHDRTEVTAAYSDIDDVSDFLAGKTNVCPRMNLVAEAFHLMKHSVYFGHDILPIAIDRSI